MPLPTSSLARICNVIREHIDTLGQPTSPADWNVRVTIGAPGANLAATSSNNTLNLFFYRFEPFAFAADTQPGEVQWVKMFCVITAFGVDEDTDSDDVVDFSAGFNELRMLSQVMRLFHEQPVMLIEGDDAGETWHTQFIPRPLADDQINQIWSTQGDTIYRPSVIYEISLAPIEPEIPTAQVARVASIGTYASGNMENRHAPWPAGRETRFPKVPSVNVDSSNPQWAPAIMMVTGLAGDRQASLSLNLEIPVAGADADFSSFPQIDIWVAGDTSKTHDLNLVGQLLQNPDSDSSSGNWSDITPVTGLTADESGLDVINPPPPSTTNFTLDQTHWTGISETNNSWQLQIFAERYIRFNAVTGLWDDSNVEDAEIRIRSNPLLITLTREAT